MTLHVVQVVCGAGFGGVERHIATLANGLAARGVDVTVLGGDQARMSSATRGVNHEQCGGPADVVRRLLGLRDVDIVHAHMTEAEAGAVIARYLNRVPVVATRHFAARRGTSRAAKLMGKILQRGLAAEIAISEFVAHDVGPHGRVIRWGTRDVPGSPVPARDRAQMVLVAQRLEVEKHTTDALKTFALSGASRLGWRLTIAGDGAQRAALYRTARELGLEDSVDFPGTVAELRPLVRSAAVVLAPTPREGLGLTVLEAMAEGTPIVATDAGGHKESVGGVKGARLYPVGDLVAAAAALRALVDDPAERDLYGRALQLRQRAEFAVERAIDQTVALYRELNS